MVVEETEDEQALFGRWRSGDARAGDRLFVRHFAAIDRYFRHKVREEEIADLVQRTFMVCVEQPSRFQERSSLRTYLLGIARNILREHYRAKAKGRYEDIDELSVIDLGAGPSSVIGLKAEQRLLLEALRSIPVAAQELLELYFWEGLTGAQLAEFLGVGEDTARTRLRRARLSVSDALKKLANSRALLESTLSDLDSWARSVRPQDPRAATSKA